MRARACSYVCVCGDICVRENICYIVFCFCLFVFSLAFFVVVCMNEWILCVYE